MAGSNGLASLSAAFWIILIVVLASASAKMDGDHASAAAGLHGDIDNVDDLADAVFAAEEYPEVAAEEASASEDPGVGNEGDEETEALSAAPVLDYEDVPTVPDVMSGDDDGEVDLSASDDADHDGVEQNQESALPMASDGEAETETENGDQAEKEVLEGQDSEAEANQTSTAASTVPAPPRYSPRRVTCLTRNMTKNSLKPEADEGSAAADALNITAPVVVPTEEDLADVFSATQQQAHLRPAAGAVQVLNGTYFLKVLSEQNDSNVTNRSSPAECSLGFFFASWCPFSARAAPHFNALPRLFPDLAGAFAVDTSLYHGINTQFGVMALPTVILFHNSKPVAKFNGTEYDVGRFAEYVTYFTGLEPSESPPSLVDADMEGPVPTRETPVTDYYLWLAWAFTAACALGYTVRSSAFRGLMEAVRKTWREAEIHHEHED